METLTINIPENKIVLVKQLLKDMGVTIEATNTPVKSNYQEKLAQVSVWADDDLKVFEETGKAFENLRSSTW